MTVPPLLQGRIEFSLQTIAFLTLNTPLHILGLWGHPELLNVPFLDCWDAHFGEPLSMVRYCILKIGGPREDPYCINRPSSGPISETF